MFLGGFLSDKLRVASRSCSASGILFGIGALVMVGRPRPHAPPRRIAAVQHRIGVFSAVDQALFLDVLPERDTEAGRFVNIIQLANVLAQAIAPFVAAAALALIPTGDRYAAIYVAAAVFTVVGGLVILKVKAVR